MKTPYATTAVDTVGVLRLRENFALRSFRSAQDDTILKLYVATGTNLPFFSLAAGFVLWSLPSVFFSVGYC